MTNDGKNETFIQQTYRAELHQMEALKGAAVAPSHHFIGYFSVDLLCM
jgi:hypothetical protein